MKRDEQRRLDEALAAGFFADRVFDALNMEGPVNPGTERILTRAREHVRMALGGQETIASGKLSSRSAENVHAYTRAMEAAITILPQKEEFKKDFTAFLNTVLSEIDNSLHEKRIDPSKVKATRFYFEALRKATARDSSSFFREEPNAPAWLLADH